MLTVFNYVKGDSMTGGINPFSISKDSKTRCSRLKLQQKTHVRLLGKAFSWKGIKAIELFARKSGEYPPLQVFKSLILPQVERWAW